MAEDRRVSHKHWQGRPERGGGVEEEEKEADDVQSHPAPRRRGSTENAARRKDTGPFIFTEMRGGRRPTSMITGHILIRMHCSDN